MGGFKQPALLGRDLDAVQDSFSRYLLRYIATLTSVASRPVVYAWITNKMDTVGVQLPSACCDLHMTRAVY